MSSTLQWRPIGGGHTLPDELKWKLRDEYSLPHKFSRYDLLFLKGLIVCEIAGAKELYEAIEQHDEVEVYEEY